MGLAAPRKRRKIGHDPNNTTWSQNEDTFGHRMMIGQGWKPGTALGANSMSSIEHNPHSISPHIRISLKDDNLGLGAKAGQLSIETFGLAALQDIYGRLNGKSETVLAKEQAHRADLGRKLYAEQKWGPARFVRGGLLVGERVENAEKAPTEGQGQSTSRQGNIRERQTAGTAGNHPHKKKSKKAKHEHVAEATDHSNIGDGPKQKVPDSNELRSENHVQELVTGESQKRKERERRKDDRLRRKIEKAARKEARDAKDGMLDRSKSPDVETESEQLGNIKMDNDTDTVTGTNPTTVRGRLPQTIPLSGRNAVRQRFIKQKRMASLDPTALREILMIKA